MHTRHCQRLGKFGSCKLVFFVFVFCAAPAMTSPAQTLTTLAYFNGTNNGASPYAGLVQATDGNFYGTTNGRGANNDGTVFKITPVGTLTTLYSFCAQPGCADGGNPDAGLVQATDGNFYGTTNGGGANNDGTVFKITPGGTLTTLYSFCSQSKCTDGANPYAGLVQATDGNFYGTTYAGGASNEGTVFKITPGGTLSRLYSFAGTDGEDPEAGLVQATDGNFYGTTGTGGANNRGTIFKITPGGRLTTLHSFAGRDGVVPDAGLVQATDGSFYGTTYAGGANNDGTIFKITPGGTLTTLHSFAGTDGEDPGAGLVEASDGSFYGTTSDGTDNDGTVFSLSPSPEQFVPVTPCRLVDTRSGGGDPIQGGTFETFNLPQLAQTNGCANLSSAASYSLNVTLVPQNGGPVGYLTIWPVGAPQPYVSTMNSPDGRVKANAAVVVAGAGGGVNVYVSNTTNVILDINGYFAPANSQSLQFYPLTPCRVVDTRGTDGPLGGPHLPAQQPRDFPILNSPCLQGLPNQPQAYSFNVTVVPNPAGQRLGYLTVWPSNEPQPNVSTLNNPTATVVANAAIVPAATDGDIDAYAYNSTDLIIDINGYFAAPGGQNALSLYPTAPCRVLDTRQSGGAFQGELTVNVVGSACAPPSNAAAYIFNATVVPPGRMPYLTLWPDGEKQPVVSILNAYDGFITSNMAVVPTNNGSIDAFAYALTQLILDIFGYFAP